MCINEIKIKTCPLKQALNYACSPSVQKRTSHKDTHKKKISIAPKSHEDIKVQTLFALFHNWKKQPWMHLLILTPLALSVFIFVVKNLRRLNRIKNKEKKLVLL